MWLNLPDEVLSGKNYLIVGAGGGFDIFGAVPFLQTLLILKQGHSVTLGSYNTSGSCKKLEQNSETYPEKQLSDWLKKKRYVNVDLWTFPKVGVQALKKMYEELIDRYEIDTLILIDGGVDSLMHGDEEGAGTLLEDSISLTAADLCNDVDRKILCCLGFGTELEEGVCHYSVLENMAHLARRQALLGGCVLCSHMKNYIEYKDACENAWENGRKSHIQTKIISAIEGEFGDTNLYEGVDAQVLGNEKPVNFISQLMSTFWFYELKAVTQENKLCKLLRPTQTSTDALMVYRQAIDQLNAFQRKRKWIPY